MSTADKLPQKQQKQREVHCAIGLQLVNASEHRDRGPDQPGITAGGQWLGRENRETKAGQCVEQCRASRRCR